ncbi:hypothetical protein ACQKE4_15025 [Halomonas sp. NPDC076908]|uniref:hypothetical protein n=1 Tax=Halomonas sp. NPDC076908 TaxID=3390567 RepID=UPI003D057899
MGDSSLGWRHWTPLLAGPLLCLLVQLFMPESLIDPAPRLVLGLTAWMAVW